MIICITGPTGIGKTCLSIELAKKYNCEIINADSAQVYKEMNIGTAKITVEEQENIPHHLLSNISIKNEYNVFLYQKEGRIILDKLLKENKNIIIVGGTSLYIKALLYDYQFTTIEDNTNYDNLSNEQLYQLVIQKEENTTIHINNRQRLISYLKTYNNKKEYNKDKLIYNNVVFISLETTRDLLYLILNKRVDKMINDGLIEEVKDLYNKYGEVKPLMSTIGYKEIISYIKEEITYEKAIELIKQHSRNYAKRQITFNKHQLNSNYLESNFINFDNTIKEALKLIEDHYEN